VNYPIIGIGIPFFRVRVNFSPTLMNLFKIKFGHMMWRHAYF